MKTRILSWPIWFLALSTFFLAVSCDKDDSSTDSTSAESTTSDIAVSASIKGGTDSLYIVHDCGGGETRDSIPETELPAAVTTYLQENYNGYTFNKAFSVNDTAGTVTGYVVVIFHEEVPVGIEFDEEGVFVRVLEQRGFGEHRGRRHGRH